MERCPEHAACRACKRMVRDRVRAFRKRKRDAAKMARSASRIISSPGTLPERGATPAQPLVRAFSTSSPLERRALASQPASSRFLP